MSTRVLDPTVCYRHAMGALPWFDQVLGAQRMAAEQALQHGGLAWIHGSSMSRTSRWCGVDLTRITAHSKAET
jgi:hypothetical protein